MINSLLLSNFRNFSKRQFKFSDKISIIVAPNASGKTNILEAIYLTSTGKSFKAGRENEMIKEGEDISRVVSKTTNTELEVLISSKEFRKRLRINGVNRRLIDFAGKFRVVLFCPEDMELVTHAPSLRRNFLDSVLSQTDFEYRRSILSYEKGIRSRNRLLYRIREENVSPSQLLFWDQLLIKNGDYISRQRAEFINYVNEKRHIDEYEFSLIYDKSVVSDARFLKYRNQEIATATTLVGPHRDDIVFQVRSTKGKGQKRNLARFGSRGEMRMAILWLKIVELSYIEKETKEAPTLLLDDIFSELDLPHRDLVLEVSRKMQTIITTADPHFISNFKNIEKIEL